MDSNPVEINIPVEVRREESKCSMMRQQQQESDMINLNQGYEKRKDRSYSELINMGGKEKCRNQKCLTGVWTSARKKSWPQATTILEGLLVEGTMALIAFLTNDTVRGPVDSTSSGPAETRPYEITPISSTETPLL